MAKGLNRKERGLRAKAPIMDECLVSKKEPINMRYLEKTAKYYVIADPNSRNYLRKISFGTGAAYEFTKNIAKATKVSSAVDAKFVIKFYREDTGDTIDLIILPLEIKYYLINETMPEEITDIDYANDMGAFHVKRN